MGAIVLTGGEVVWFDDQDAELVTPYHWHALRTKTGVYAVSNPTIRDGSGRRRPLRMHRVILGAEPGHLVDHRDGDGLNNRRPNLRITDQAGNSQNARRRVDNSTGYRGVSRRGAAYARHPFVAYISVRKLRLNLGYYATAEEAARAYDVAAEAVHGEFARANGAHVDVVTRQSVDSKVREVLQGKAANLSDLMKDPRIAQSLFRKAPR